MTPILALRQRRACIGPPRWEARWSFIPALVFASESSSMPAAEFTSSKPTSGLTSLRLASVWRTRRHLIPPFMLPSEARTARHCTESSPLGPTKSSFRLASVLTPMLRVRRRFIPATPRIEIQQRRIYPRSRLRPFLYSSLIAPRVASKLLLRGMAMRCLKRLVRLLVLIVSWLLGRHCARYSERGRSWRVYRGGGYDEF